MNKTALITGSTDGIGNAIAIELAMHNYTIHVLGRNKEKGEATLKKLQEINSTRNHELFLVDLASIKVNLEFVEQYLKRYNKLDLLILNANTYPKNVSITEDKIDQIFAVGYVSRYIFSVKLDQLLANSEDSRVIHIGDVTLLKSINYKRLSNPNYGSTKATYQSYTGSAFLVYFLGKTTKTTVPHEFHHPGIVNTSPFKELHFIFRFLLKLERLGSIEPEQSGKIIVKHILETRASDIAGKFYVKGKLKAPKKKLINGIEKYKKLIAFTEQLTNIKMADYIKL